jgi:hypothetical protein
MAQTWTSKNYHKNDKIYRGSFNYFRNENLYAEENFDVFRDRKEQTYHYISECSVRVSTGETLNIHVEYIVNKESVPLYVFVEKIMGKEHSKEIYDYSMKRSILTYKFSSTHSEEVSEELVTPPKFHIATPTALTSMLFIRTKKFDASGKNIYTVLLSDNNWEFVAPPRFTNPIVERIGLANEKITIDGQNVLATPYKMYDEATDFKVVKDPAHIRIFISPHGGIPYTVRTDEGTKIQIKYLNDLSEKE